MVGEIHLQCNWPSAVLESVLHKAKGRHRYDNLGTHGFCDDVLKKKDWLFHINLGQAYFGIPSLL